MRNECRILNENAKMCIKDFMIEKVFTCFVDLKKPYLKFIYTLQLLNYSHVNHFRFSAMKPNFNLIENLTCIYYL